MNTQQNKIALVTGATRGIGLETVRQLARAGVHTLLAGRKRETALVLALELQAEGLPVEALQLDVTDAGSIDAAVRDVGQRHGRLDILVNNAGVLLEDPSLPPSAQPLDTWRRTFDTNVHALVAVTQAFLPLLRRSAAGRIVNVSSILGSQALHADPASPIYDFKVPAYNASKAAVNNWTLSLAYELRATPIKVNTVHPGYVRTDMNAGEGEIDVADGARSSVQMALLDADGPSGSFTHLGQVLPW
ncbi:MULTISPECIES: SDR family oxidoreductase [Stenotrophomonas]|jgi:NAD(P)-dependent dehydrogenase (short-subunit alcohol dehydrogenase family)|uniref:Short-chain dehydrogenase/reductase n=1 Tax=Stenotrophomonas acidaminiphila TaxID=128780 RepID=A0A0R0DTI2_9GAMM|nr:MULTISPECIES: SDR family oxidoreductase [Stenotrophomonas]OZB67551.1 MAG: short-chain dehydrogenase [Xanthomonadales bacterium 14-68-21]ALJ28077.1 short-chain dehydrogenase/reductase [Stenotrophomonas acidaminiphila]KRG84837.1 short-chain dehydrogenase [Stenotrophomonas acidaminiphila]MCA7024684.1 SDR family oxidoreductase [Stenotrophomonas acidaminiphila]MCE4074558.1 SDR family oxidoreductase [Stenotrophomonas acidaminiphila]